MVENLSTLIQQEWNLTNSEPFFNNSDSRPNRLSQKQSLARRTSDQAANSNGHTHGQHHHTHQQPIHAVPSITTSDYSDRSSLGLSSMPQMLSSRRSLEAGYDTDGAIGTLPSISRSRPSHDYEHFVSPRLSTRRATNKSSMELPPVPHRQPSPRRTHLEVELYSNSDASREERNAEGLYGDDTRRRHIRLSRRLPARAPTAHHHGTHVAHASTIPRHERTFSGAHGHRPFKLIFMRHSERANQALGADWFSKAFRTNTYNAFDQNLPTVLPRRHSNHAYEFDPPLTVRGLSNAQSTGRAMKSINLLADVCLCSSALRCIQTADQVLKGMELVDHVPIRVEPGLFECPHLNNKIIESFMTKKELAGNGFSLHPDYKPLIPKLHVPEALDEYFTRCALIMRNIIDLYGRRGGTILIVTHAPGLLALTRAINGIKPTPETFYRTVATYPPLAFFAAEYNGTIWEHSEQPFCLTPMT